MNIACWLERMAQIRPEQPALFLGRDPVADYGAFHTRAAAVGAWLRAQGIGAGDRVALFMKNCPEYLTAQYGAWYAGAVIVPINAKLHGREAAWIVEDSGAKMVFVTSSQGVDLAEAGAGRLCVDVRKTDFGSDTIEVTPRETGDLCWLFYTSGTTGRPKGVMISNAMLVAMSLSYLADVDQVSAQDAAIYAAPLSHGAGIYNMVHVLHGARHVFPVSGGFDEGEIFDLAGYFGRAHLFAAPTMVKRMTRYAKTAGQSGEGIRTVVYAGGPMYLADIIDAVDHFGDKFVQIYGQGECPMGITVLPRRDVDARGLHETAGRRRIRCLCQRSPSSDG